MEPSANTHQSHVRTELENSTSKWLTDRSSFSLSYFHCPSEQAQVSRPRSLPPRSILSWSRKVVVEIHPEIKDKMEFCFASLPTWSHAEECSPRVCTSLESHADPIKAWELAFCCCCCASQLPKTKWWIESIDFEVKENYISMSEATRLAAKGINKNSASNGDLLNNRQPSFKIITKLLSCDKNLNKKNNGFERYLCAYSSHYWLHVINNLICFDYRLYFWYSDVDRIIN